VAKAHFLADTGDLESAALRLGTAKKKGGDDGLSGELDAVVEAVKAVPWTALQELKGDAEFLKKIDDAEAMLRSLRKALS
jgi:ParB family transcriptional regulator, chromosome partitioning protein